MSIQKYRQVVLFEGNPLPGVSCLIKLAGTNTLATLYDDITGVIPKTNPFVNNPVYGSMEFYAEEGLVDVFPTKVGYTLEELFNELVGAPSVLTNGPFTVTSLNGVPFIVAANAIPTGAKDVSVFVLNTVGFGTSQGLTGYDVGDGLTQDKWGRNIPLTLNNQTRQQDFTGDVSGIYTAPTTVYLTALGGTFDGVGQATVVVKYHVDGP